jgi:DNA-binding response OmpR family regulator
MSMNKKILIVDDDPDVRLALHARLKANHFDTFFAADAMSAVVEARKHQPDLIILDLGMPAGGGFAVMDRLRTNTYLAMTPVIVVTARDREANEERAMQAGARSFLQKPVNDKQLLSVIGRLLGTA